MKRLIMLTCLVASHVTTAGTPKLEPFKGPTATVSFPKGWVVQQDNGGFAAQQDPKKKDAAGILFAYMPNAANATEDQLLDALVAQVSKDLKVSERAAIKGGVGHYLVGDGTSDGVKVRVGTVAVVINGQAIVSLLVAKTAEFNALGGLELATLVLASLQPNAPQAAPAPVAAPPPASPHSGKLEIGTPSRAVTVADLAGDWTQDDNVVTSYASSSSSSGGYSAAATAAKWRIDPKGIIYTKLTATTASNRGMTYQVNEKTSATITISADGILTIARKKGEGASSSYFIRGWGTTAELSVLQLNGPYYSEPIEVAKLRTDPHYASNLNGYWVRMNPKTN